MLAFVLVAAALEEWVFRGVLLRLALDRSGDRTPAWAVVASGALFAAYHLSLYQLLPTFLLGVALAAVAVALESVWPALVAHAALNALGILVFTLTGGGPPSGG